MNANINTVQLAMDTADQQLNAAWIEIDKDDYDHTEIESRLELVNSLLKNAEKTLARYNKETAEA